MEIRKEEGIKLTVMWNQHFDSNGEAKKHIVKIPSYRFKDENELKQKISEMNVILTEIYYDAIIDGSVFSFDTSEDREKFIEQFDKKHTK